MTGPAGSSLLVRREAPGDVAAVREVHRLALARAGAAGPPVEVRLLDELRADPGWLPRLSLVAEESTGDGGRTVAGHVVCTRGALRTPDGEVAVLGLGPRPGPW